MRLAVQQLLRAADLDLPSQASQSAAKEHAVCVGEQDRSLAGSCGAGRFGEFRGFVDVPGAPAMSLALVSADWVDVMYLLL